ncbi:MAG: hypothetical protein K0S40_3976 [Actinomycetospora sp.]|nr:hypothetical protein [Actinomycetospora sp.]
MRVEWIVAVGAFLVISVVVIGVPLYLATVRWSSRQERRAAEARRRAAAAHLAVPSAPAPPRAPAKRRPVSR